MQECAERTLLTAIVTNLVCAWVISELEFIGKEECAKTLERYWRERNVDDLIQILKFAQFPEPMSDS